MRETSFRRKKSVGNVRVRTSHPVTDAIRIFLFCKVIGGVL